jgi:cytochrome c-type biogenesis protein CcmH/NrfG
MELVVRPAQKDSVWGYGLTVYCYAGGADTSRAGEILDEALKQTVPVLIASAEAMLASPDAIDIS